MTPTSRIAYDGVQPHMTERQRAVLAWFRKHGPAIDETLELAMMPGMTPQSARSRRAELVKAGLIMDAGERKRNSRDGLCTVWRAVDRPETQGSLFG